ncbi:biotin-independent malonate decarboxylase subunit gamma [Thiomonas sp. FB-Cd]|uniref:biotin-independent malonate decarboxylase subunit gamma n=1 Tax=Thiomonas sp. FB-Cd TaxID=1158292 RepID=UPI0004DF0261|nr:biotin-independent malonate decarboxylase subunit gamma [Thiomonas sp. FB-Cd]
MSGAPAVPTRGQLWFGHLDGQAPRVPGLPPSVLAADAMIAHRSVRYLAVVPDSSSPFVRARRGEVGLREGWALAHAVRDAVELDRDGVKRALVAIVDVPSQAYGRREEMLGIHLACAAAVDAYASARMAGHPVVALLVGAAMSGAFLAHGFQAHRLVALDDPGVVVHAMGREAAARVTRRTLAELEELGRANPPMSYRIADFDKLGLLHRLIAGVQADAPTPADVEVVRGTLAESIADIAPWEASLSRRLSASASSSGRSASAAVRERLAAQW